MEFNVLNRNKVGRSVSLRLNSSYKWKAQTFQRSRPLDMNELHEQQTLCDLLKTAASRDAWMFERPSLFERKKKLSTTVLQQQSKNSTSQCEKTELPSRYQNKFLQAKSKLHTSSLGTLEENWLPSGQQLLKLQARAKDTIENNQTNDLTQALDWIQEELLVSGALKYFLVFK
ncbi:hypothetical protein HELRODRAFT_165463 [Helobdella robusta]|uniref:Uncharacterized protein n=1 Tax=Helobdella robusta TaxID=6412 RepID=T1EWU4_HELRO|nr:hypothetical protein HELRODRAFT_165463 [Helobdella robusta]ESN91429.1 hypothetical protein HELRODRAFT_165463 [Helobdella robusta]